MGRPTIKDLADAAEVSVSTVNRVLGGRANVRAPTIARVLSAAERIGFYGTGAIQNRLDQSRQSYTFAILMHQPGRRFYEVLGDRLLQAAAETEEADVTLRIEFMDDLSPNVVAERMIAAGRGTDGLALTVAEHPLVSSAVETLAAEDVPVASIISPLTGTGLAHYIGLDHFKLGRTAGWFLHRLSPDPCKIGILVGNHRYRNQDQNESGFRSYFREHAPEFTLLDPGTTYESKAIAQELTEAMLRDHPDLKGLFMAGGGITGVMQALRQDDHGHRVKALGLELFDLTRAGLIDGTLTMCLSHPLQDLARATIDVLIKARNAGTAAGRQSVLLPFSIHTRENI